MMSPHKFGLFLGVSLLATACNVGQGIKTLGKTSSNSTATSSTDAETFSLTLAYRDAGSDLATPSRLVAIQGVRGVAAANLSYLCGSTGANCLCDFYKTSTSAAVTATTAGISSQNNSLSCTIPSGITDADIRANSAGMYVALRRIDISGKNSGLVAITSNLTIENVLGSTLSRTKVRGIFRYDCTRNFFEGEGVSATSISCVAGQHLGQISAAYNFYTYKSGEDSNTGGGDTPFPTDICSRNNQLKIQCTGSVPVLHYGLYKENADPFVVAITMTRAPAGDNLSSIYGYAALPDSAGNCPTGLVKIRPYMAQPASIVPTSSSCVSNSATPVCPTSFINTDNTLSNTVVETSAPSNFTVTRQPNAVPCAADGTCTTASFGGSITAQSVAYTPLTPVVCAIPQNLLTGLF